MKIAAMIGAPDLETEPLAVFNGDLVLALEKTADLGYDGVEIMTKDPSRLDGESLRREIVDRGLVLVGLCTGHVFGEDGVGLVGPDPTSCSEAMRRLKSFVDFSETFFGGTALVNIGRARGPGFPDDAEKTFQRMVESFQELADYAGPKGVRLVLEPVNAGQTNFICTTEDGIDVVQRVDRSNFGLMLDIYHMRLEDPSIEGAVRSANDRCWFVHVADDDRKWPGSGGMPFKELFRSLDEIGYDGFVSTEIRPWPNGAEAARMSIEYLRQFVPRNDGSLQQS